MARRRKLAMIAYLCAAAATLPAATASAATTIAVEPYTSKLAAYGGLLAWSHWNGTAFQLMVRYHGTVRALPVAPRSVPFDVSLGPDAQRHTVAVYSRCAREQSTWTLGVSFARFHAPGGCVLYRYNFATGQQARIPHIVGSGSFYLPTIWQNEIAYVRVGRSGAPALFEQPLTGTRRRPVRAISLPGGPASATRGPGPVSLDLRAGELAFAWHDVSGATFNSTVYLDALPITRRGPVTQTAYDTESAPASTPGLLDFTALTARGLFYARSDGSTISPAADAFELLASGAGVARTRAAPHTLFAASSDGRSTYALYGLYTGSIACAPPGCSLVSMRGAF